MSKTFQESLKLDDSEVMRDPTAALFSVHAQMTDWLQKKQSAAASRKSPRGKSTTHAAGTTVRK